MYRYKCSKLQFFLVQGLKRNFHLLEYIKIIVKYYEQFIHNICTVNQLIFSVTFNFVCAFMLKQNSVLKLVQHIHFMKTFCFYNSD